MQSRKHQLRSKLRETGDTKENKSHHGNSWTDYTQKRKCHHCLNSIKPLWFRPTSSLFLFHILTLQPLVFSSVPPSVMIVGVLLRLTIEIQSYRSDGQLLWMKSIHALCSSVGLKVISDPDCTQGILLFHTSFITLVLCILTLDQLLHIPSHKKPTHLHPKILWLSIPNFHSGLLWAVNRGINGPQKMVLFLKQLLWKERTGGCFCLVLRGRERAQLMRVAWGF